MIKTENARVNAQLCLLKLFKFREWIKIANNLVNQVYASLFARFHQEGVLFFPFLVKRFNLLFNGLQMLLD